jgi:hypothetical protein
MAIAVGEEYEMKEEGDGLIKPLGETSPGRFALIK